MGDVSATNFHSHIEFVLPPQIVLVMQYVLSPSLQDPVSKIHILMLKRRIQSDMADHLHIREVRDWSVIVSHQFREY